MLSLDSPLLFGPRRASICETVDVARGADSAVDPFARLLVIMSNHDPRK